MPGIIDSHVHLGMMHDVTQDEKYETPENVQADLKQYAAYGVTSVQVLGTDKDFVLDLRNQQRKSRPTMARIFSAGQGAVMKGGYGGLVGVTNPISTPEEARKLVDEQAAKGVDFIKLWMDDERKTIPVKMTYDSFARRSSTKRTRSTCAPWRMSSIWPMPRNWCAKASTVSPIWCATSRWTRNC